MINDCLADGEREEAEKKLKNGGTITLQITNSEGETDTQEVNTIENGKNIVIGTNSYLFQYL